MTRALEGWTNGLADPVEALAETLHAPRQVKVTDGTKQEHHVLLWDRVAHARNALVTLRGEGAPPDLGKFAEWLYANASHKVAWDEDSR